MEQWKDIKGFEDYYEVSNLGNVRSKVSERKLKPFANSRGYLQVDLYFLKPSKRIPIHQLVMQTFSPDGYFEGADIDHKDGNKHNNALSNLEYVTHAENVLRHYKSKAELMIGVSPNGEEFEFLVISEFARNNGLEFRHVSACLQGKLAQHKGWKFYYKSEGKPRMTAQKKDNSNKKCIATSPDGTAYEFLNQRIFAEERNLSRRQINACLNGRSGSHKGWTFHYKEEN